MYVEGIDMTTNYNQALGHLKSKHRLKGYSSNVSYLTFYPLFCLKMA
jgi:hypothetical protein